MPCLHERALWVIQGCVIQDLEQCGSAFDLDFRHIHFNCLKYSPHAAIHFWSLSVQLKNASLDFFFQTTKPFFQAMDWQVKNDKRKMKMVYLSCFSYWCWNVWKCWSSFSPIFVLVWGSKQDQVIMWTVLFSALCLTKSPQCQWVKTVLITTITNDAHCYKWCTLLQMMHTITNDTCAGSFIALPVNILHKVCHWMLPVFQQKVGHFGVNKFPCQQEAVKPS